MAKGSGRIAQEWVRYWWRKRMGEGPHWLRELAEEVWEFLMRDICVYVPMSLRARTSVPDKWWIVKVTEKYQDLQW